MATNNSINSNSTGLVKYNGSGTYSGVTVTNHNLLVGAASNGITSLALTDGQLAIGSTGADPVAATLTAGSNITITPGAGTITIASTGGGGGGITWNTVSGTTQSAAVNNGYITNNASLVTVTLPASAAVGDMVEVAGKGAGGWLVAQNSGQVIHMDGVDSTTGTGGSIASTVQYDAVRLLCITTNTDWLVLSGIGNLTVT